MDRLAELWTTIDKVHSSLRDQIHGEFSGSFFDLFLSSNSPALESLERHSNHVLCNSGFSMGKRADYTMSVPVVSLSHLSKSDLDILYNKDESWPRVAVYGGGIFCWMLYEDIVDEWEGGPDLQFSFNFWECFKRHFSDETSVGETVAIRFDVDGEVLNDLAVFT